MSPVVRRSRMSRGTTRRIAFGRRTRTLPNSSRSVTTARPSGPPSKPPLRLRSTSAMAPGGGGSATRLTIPTGCPASPRSSARRGAWSETEHDARPLAQPVLDAVDQALRPARRQHRLAPAEQVARGQALRREGHPGRLARLGLPGELQRPRAVEPRLPVARREEGLRPVLGQLALLHELSVALLGLAPQEVGGLGEVAGLVEDEQGGRVEMVEARGRGDEPRPHLRRVARGQRAPRRDRRGPLGRRLAGEPCQVQRRGAPAAARPAGRGAPGSHPPLRRAAGTRSPAGA